MIEDGRVTLGHVVVCWLMAVLLAFVPTGDSTNDLLWRFVMSAAFGTMAVLATAHWIRDRRCWRRQQCDRCDGHGWIYERKP